VTDNVDMGCASRIVAREDCGELYSTICIGLLRASQEDFIQVGFVVRIAVGRGDGAAVDSRRIGICGFRNQSAAA
jgi:hypothetical protein